MRSCWLCDIIGDPRFFLVQFVYDIQLCVISEGGNLGLLLFSTVSHTVVCDVIGYLQTLFVLCCSIPQTRHYTTTWLCRSVCDMVHCPRTNFCFTLFHLYTNIPQSFCFIESGLHATCLGVRFCRKIGYFGLMHASKVQNIFFIS